MPKLQFEMGRGGVLTAKVLVDQVPKTWTAIRAVLPITLTTLNARWSGKEIHNQIDLPDKPPRENQVIHASLGDVIYGREFPETHNYTGFEAIGLFYAAETVHDWRGVFPVNRLGCIDPSQWPLIQEIGDRIYRHGGEDCTISAID